MKARLMISAATAGLAMHAGIAGAQTQSGSSRDGQETVIVTGEQANSALVGVPGSTAVISASNLQTGSIANVEDALKSVPGLFAQSVGGDEATRIAIRGSGRASGGFTWGSGIQTLLDGLPLSTIYGNPYESFEPNAYNSIEVYKGANAFEYGANSLGGVINFVEHTGYDSAPLFLRAEGGSYGYQREQISSGQVLGPLDYYVTVTHYQTDGYLDNAAGYSSRAIANVGYQITPDLKTRFYFEFAQQHQQHINSVTYAQFLADPRSNVGVTGDRVNDGSLTVANKTSWNIDPDSNVELGLEYTRPPIHDGTANARVFWNTKDWAELLRYRRHDVIGGHESNTTLALISTFAIPGSGLRAVDTTNNNAYIGSIEYHGSNVTVLASNDFALTPNLWLLTGVSGLFEHRENLITNPVAAGVNPKLTKNYSDFAPRFGLRYDVDANLHVYANATKLVEAPSAGSYGYNVNWKYSGYTTTNNGITFDSHNLKVQSGWSYEIGTRGSFDRFTWDIDYYNEQVKNELLTVYAVLPSPTYPAGISFTQNASPTVHEGVELSLDALLYQDSTNRFTFHNNYTYGNFYFDQRTALQHALPGQPRHVYQGQLEYNSTSGFYAKAELDAVANYAVDFANSKFAPGYALIGAALGYTPPGGNWRIFLQGQNLADKAYVSFTSTTGIASASSAVYTPGEGRSISIGVSYAFQ